MKIGQNFPQILTDKGVRGSYVTSRSVTTTEIFNVVYLDIFSQEPVGLRRKAYNLC